jgi:hypothetical protein
MGDLTGKMLFSYLAAAFVARLSATFVAGETPPERRSRVAFQGALAGLQWPLSALYAARGAAR